MTDEIDVQTRKLRCKLEDTLRLLNDAVCFGRLHGLTRKDLGYLLWSFADLVEQKRSLDIMISIVQVDEKKEAGA